MLVACRLAGLSALEGCKPTAGVRARAMRAVVANERASGARGKPPSVEAKGVQWPDVGSIAR